MKTMGGVGGYGGISTMNQDQRQPRYMPHNNVVLYTRMSDNTTEVKCLACGEKWEHPRGSRANAPEKCVPPPIVLEPEEEGATFESYVTEDNEVRWRKKSSGDEQC